MANTTEVSQAGEDNAGSLPITISQDEFHNAVTEVYVHYLRNIALLTQDDSALSLLSMPAERLSGYDLLSPDYSAEDIGISYKLISHSHFAQTLDLIYDFAFFARLDMTAEQMGDGTSYTFISTLLADAAYGYTAENWNDFGHPIMDYAKKCLLVAEIANARCVLEGMESFYHFSISIDRAEDAVGVDALTIRQMALLSGMEEQSVRAAANPKRANRLQTNNEDGRTRIPVIAAKLWLSSKGRDIPVTRYVPDDEIDFSKRGFSNTNDLMIVINHRYKLLVSRDDQVALDAGLCEAGMEASVDVFKAPGLYIEEADFNDNERMKRLAQLLKWPADIFALRCREAVAKNAVTNIERELRAMNLSLKTE